MSLIKFEGNCPANVARDAKYTVRRGEARGQSLICLTYRAPGRERWYATTEAHPELVKIVNDLKIQLTRSPHGAFYINEFKQVLVPTLDSRDYYLAGVYGQDLEFEFEGKTLTGKPFNLEGDPINPGDQWEGPHPGIPYKLFAGAKDIGYTIHPRPRVEKEIRLSDYVGNEDAQNMAKRIAEFKGFEGGRFYINEHKTLFTPLQEGDVLRYIYIGQLSDKDAWFPKPHS